MCRFPDAKPELTPFSHLLSFQLSFHLSPVSIVSLPLDDTYYQFPASLLHLVWCFHWHMPTILISCTIGTHPLSSYQCKFVWCLNVLSEKYISRYRKACSSMRYMRQARMLWYICSCLIFAQWRNKVRFSSDLDTFSLRWECGSGSNAPRCSTCKKSRADEW